MNNDKNKRPRRGTPPHLGPATEKASIGGKYNSGVTSDDPVEKEEINKKGSMYEKQPDSDDDRSRKQQDKPNEPIS